MKDVYRNIEEYNLGKKRKVLTVFDDMIVDLINSEIDMISKFFNRGRKLIIF